MSVQSSGSSDARILVMRDIVKSFGESRVLDGVSIEVRRGEVVCLIGPSGSGKSTLIKCANALERPDSGEVIFEGNPVLADHKDVRTVRRRMGMVFQNFELFPHLTALSNVSRGPRTVLGWKRASAEAAAIELLRKVGLADYGHHYPSQLSGGQQQRVAIARALAMSPALMLSHHGSSIKFGNRPGSMSVGVKALAAGDEFFSDPHSPNVHRTGRMTH